MIIAITDHDDEDIDRLKHYCSSKGVRFVPFRLGLSENEYDLSWRLNHEITLRSVNTVISPTAMADAKLVLYRRWRMDSPPVVRCAMDDFNERRFAEREWDALLVCALRELERLSPQSWVNPTGSSHDPNLKICFLTAAANLSIPVPPSYLGTRLALPATSKNFICKAINKHHQIDEVRHFPTSTLAPSLVKDLGSERISCPSFVQEKIEGRDEARIYVIGTEVVEVRITSPELYDDVSMVSAGLTFSDHSSPTALREALVKLCRHFDMKYCVFDMKIDETGKQWLVDVTPNGSWSWIDRAGYDMTSRMGAAMFRHINFHASIHTSNGANT